MSESEGLSAEGLALLDLAHENAALRGALRLLLDAAKAEPRASTLRMAAAMTHADEVLERFAAETVRPGDAK